MSHKVQENEKDIWQRDADIGNNSSSNDSSNSSNGVIVRTSDDTWELFYWSFVVTNELWVMTQTTRKTKSQKSKTYIYKF